MYRNRLNSVAVSSMSAALAPDLVGLVVHLQVGELEPVAPGAGVVRRRTAWMRATSSSRLKGLVT